MPEVNLHFNADLAISTNIESISLSIHLREADDFHIEYLKCALSALEIHMRNLQERLDEFHRNIIERSDLEAQEIP